MRSFASNFFITAEGFTLSKSLWPSLLNYGLDQPHVWRAKKALKQISFNEFAQCITLRRELSVPQQQEPISPSSNISLSNHVPVMGKETVPVIPVMAKEATPICPATVQEAKSSEISQLIVPPILNRETVPQISASKTTSSECMVYASLPKTAVILSFSQRQPSTQLRPPVAAVNPLLHPMMDTDLSPSFPCGDFCTTPVSSGRHHLLSQPQSLQCLLQSQSSTTRPFCLPFIPVLLWSGHVSIFFVCFV